MSFKRKMNRQILARERKIYRKEVARQVKRREAIQQIKRIKWIEYDDVFNELSYTPRGEMRAGTNTTYVSEEMFFMSPEKRQEIMKTAVEKDKGHSYGSLDKWVSTYGDGVSAFCADRQLLIRDKLDGILPGYSHDIHEAYLVECTYSLLKGHMGVLYFPYSLEVDLDEEDFRLVSVDLRLKSDE